jgi:hypothetical protein
MTEGNLINMTSEKIARLNEEKGKRAVFYFEGAKRSVLAAEVLLQRLGNELAELEPIIHQTPNVADKFGPILVTAMGIVDFAHRFGQLMEGMPLLKDAMRRKYLQKLREALSPVTETRNHLQHLRNELSAGSSIDYPLMGSLTWANGDQCYAVGLLTQGFEVTFPSMAFGAFGVGYVARFQYTVSTQCILLDPLVATMRESFDWLASKMVFTHPNYDKAGWGQTLAFTSAMRIEMTPIDSASD